MAAPVHPCNWSQHRLSSHHVLPCFPHAGSHNSFFFIHTEIYPIHRYSAQDFINWTPSAFFFEGQLFKITPNQFLTVAKKERKKNTKKIHLQQSYQAKTSTAEIYFWTRSGLLERDDSHKPGHRHATVNGMRGARFVRTHHFSYKDVHACSPTNEWWEGNDWKGAGKRSWVTLPLVPGQLCPTFLRDNLWNVFMCARMFARDGVWVETGQKSCGCLKSGFLMCSGWIRGIKCEVCVCTLGTWMLTCVHTLWDLFKGFQTIRKSVPVVFSLCFFKQNFFSASDTQRLEYLELLLFRFSLYKSFARKHDFHQMNPSLTKTLWCRIERCQLKYLPAG